MSIVTIYGNLDNSYISTSGNGTTAIPYNKDQIEDYFNCFAAVTPKAYNNTNITQCLLKGQWIEPAGNATFLTYLSGAKPMIFDAWDLSAYGPWKIMGSDNTYNTLIEFATPGALFNSDLTFKNGVIGYPKIVTYYYELSSTVQFKNILIYYGLSTQKDYSFDKFYGCTFVSASINLNNYQVSATGDRAIFENSIFYNSNFGNTQYENIQFSGCEFSGTSALTVGAISASATFTNTTFDWIPSNTMPDFTAVSSSNKNNLLYTSFGFIPFLCGRTVIGSNDYRKGIFGEPRIGKGAFYFATDCGIYIDLSSTATSGYGTSSVPFGGDEFVYNVMTSNICQFENETYKLKGLKLVSAATSINFASNYGIVNYTNIPNESWKLVITSSVGGAFIGTGNIGQHPNLYNGVIQFEINSYITFSRAEEIGIESMILSFCNASFPRFYYCSNDLTNKKGNTIICQGNGIQTYPGTPGGSQIIRFTDSILDISFIRSNNSPSPGVSTSAILNGCVLTAPDVSALDALSGFWSYRLSDPTKDIGSSIYVGSGTNACQFNWCPPTWPDRTAFSKNDYSLVALTSAGPITISGTGGWV